jgi:hypothetical protein
MHYLQKLHLTRKFLSKNIRWSCNSVIDWRASSKLLVTPAGQPDSPPVNHIRGCTLAYSTPTPRINILKSRKYFNQLITFILGSIVPLQEHGAVTASRAVGAGSVGAGSRHMRWF